MVKRLLIMRHAKSSRDDPSLPDHERPLNMTGQQEAPLAAQQIAKAHWLPEFILCSDAIRTKETCDLVTKAWQKKIPVTFANALYEASVQDWREQIEDLPDEFETVMFIGHNPTCEEVASLLCGHPLHMKTASVVLLTSPADSWSHATSQQKNWKIHQHIHDFST